MLETRRSKRATTRKSPFMTTDSIFMCHSGVELRSFPPPPFPPPSKGRGSPREEIKNNRSEDRLCKFPSPCPPPSEGRESSWTKNVIKKPCRRQALPVSALTLPSPVPRERAAHAVTKKPWRSVGSRGPQRWSHTTQGRVGSWEGHRRWPSHA